MDSHYLISIIIPTYNRSHLIEKTIESALNQTNRDFEIIVVDDGSTDDTEKVISKYLSESFRYYKIDNAERGAARNFGTRKARGSYVNWFDSDDLLFDNHVETISASVKAFSNADFFILNFDNYFPLKDSFSANAINPSVFNDNKFALIKGNFFSCNGVIVRKDIALKNPFIEDRKLSASEDYELWLRLVSKYQGMGIDTVTSTIVHHDQRSVFTMNQLNKLEDRFNAFIHYATNESSVVAFLGQKLRYFKMRNYLILAVDLAYNGHKRKAFRYLFIASKNTPAAFTQKVFWATLKHICIR